MNVEDVQQTFARKSNIATQAPPAFAMSPGNIVVLANLHREPAESQIAVAAAVKPTILSETNFIPIQHRLDSAHLVEFGAAILDLQNFLKSDNVSIDRKST